MKKVLSAICLVLLFGAAAFLFLLRYTASVQTGPSAAPAPTAAQTPAPAVSAAPVPTPTPEPTPTPTPEPTPEYFVVTYIGDQTLCSHQNGSDFEKKMNGDYSYPFSNVVQYFADDEYTIANLEMTFSDQKLWSYETFYFRAPAASAQILVEGGIDFVTTANNHTNDFNSVGPKDTAAALDAVGVEYGLMDEAKVVTTPHGLKLGIYCTFDKSFLPKEDKAIAAIEQLKAEGADYIICAFHWGIEKHYHPTDKQVALAHACIDAGADMIYGSHSHCLQPIEEYNGGLILYSMGELSFGGNTSPWDPDSAIVQVTMRRDPDGTVTHESYSIIPCCVSSRPVLENFWSYGYNDYKPTPYVEGTAAYERALSKILGTYEGPDGQSNYSNWHARSG